FDGLFSHKFFLLRAPPSKLLLEDLINEKRSKKARSLTSSFPRPTMFSKLSFRAEGQENFSFGWADNARSLPGARLCKNYNFVQRRLSEVVDIHQTTRATPVFSYF